MKYLGIDYGIKRVGLAITSSNERMVLPYRTLKRIPKKAFFDQLLKILERENIEGIVVGLPLDENHRETLSSRQVKNFIKELKKHTSLPIYLVEEAYTTYEALEKLKQRGMSSRQIKKIVDQVAAMEILKYFLAEGSFNENG